MPPAPRIRPYKDFLTPALHRRFAMATAALTALCYCEAILIGEWNSYLWSWFPFGRAGIRTGLLFIPAFMIFILRVAQLHVGFRTSNSAAHTFKQYAFRYETIQTAGWYLLSAYLFSEIYIWSAPKSADLNRIKMMAKVNKPTLNERPIYLTSYLFFLALLQTGFHLYYDYDRIDMPVNKTKPEAVSDLRAHFVVPAAVQLRTKLPGLALDAFYRTVGMSVMFPIIYSLTTREYAWRFTRFWAKVFWNLPKSGAVPNIRPFHWSALMQTATAGCLLMMLWEFGNAAFSIYVAQEPLKNDRPITYESKDPNGSLLTGLKGKKLQTRAFAFWELVYIAQQFQGRRKNIFEDIDRKGGSAWSQILAICLEVITGIDARITEFEAPTVIKKPEGEKKEEIPSLPRIGQPLKDGLKQPGDLFDATPPPKSRGAGVIQAVGSFAKAHGQSPPGPLPRNKLLELGLSKFEDIALPPKKKDLKEKGLVGLLKNWAILILNTKAGWPFRQEYRRRVAAIVLGSPYGDVGIIVDAVDSLTRLAVCSLKEDKYGNVQRDIKLIIRTFTTTVTKLERFKKSIGFHWSDVVKKEESPEVDSILAALKDGLKELISDKAFGDYSDDLRLSQSEMRQAREAATPAKAREMQQTGI